MEIEEEDWFLSWTASYLQSAKTSRIGFQKWRRRGFTEKLLSFLTGSSCSSVGLLQ